MGHEQKAGAGTIFSKYSQPIEQLGYAVQEYILSALPGITEEVDIPDNLLGYSYGPGYKNTICTIIASKTMMKVGFYKGSELPDPTGILKGTGKVHKHVEVKNMDDIADPALAILLEEAVRRGSFAERK